MLGRNECWYAWKARCGSRLENAAAAPHLGRRRPDDDDSLGRIIEGPAAAAAGLADCE